MNHFSISFIRHSFPLVRIRKQISVSRFAFARSGLPTLSHFSPFLRSVIMTVMITAMIGGEIQKIHISSGDRLAFASYVQVQSIDSQYGIDGNENSAELIFVSLSPFIVLRKTTKWKIIVL